MNKKIAYAIPVLIVAAIILCGSLRFGVVSLFITIPVAIIVGIAMIIYDKRLADNAVPTTSSTLQDSVGTYGEPDDIIVTDATRSDEADGTLLVYHTGGRDNRGRLVYNGVCISLADITDVTFHNKFGTAFGLPDEYEIVISTTDADHPKLSVCAGRDLSLTKDSVKEIEKLTTR